MFYVPTVQDREGDPPTSSLAERPFPMDGTPSSHSGSSSNAERWESRVARPGTHSLPGTTNESAASSFDIRLRRAQPDASDSILTKTLADLSRQQSDHATMTEITGSINTELLPLSRASTSDIGRPRLNNSPLPLRLWANANAYLKPGVHHRPSIGRATSDPSYFGKGSLARAYTSEIDVSVLVVHDPPPTPMVHFSSMIELSAATDDVKRSSTHSLSLPSSDASVTSLDLEAICDCQCVRCLVVDEQPRMGFFERTATKLAEWSWSNWKKYNREEAFEPVGHGSDEHQMLHATPELHVLPPRPDEGSSQRCPPSVLTRPLNCMSVLAPPNSLSVSRVHSPCTSPTPSVHLVRMNTGPLDPVVSKARRAAHKTDNMAVNRVSFDLGEGEVAQDTEADDPKLSTIDRALSNLSSSETHFRRHRDSLALAYHRLLNRHHSGHVKEPAEDGQLQPPPKLSGRDSIAIARDRIVQKKERLKKRVRSMSGPRDIPKSVPLVGPHIVFGGLSPIIDASPPQDERFLNASAGERSQRRLSDDHSSIIDTVLLQDADKH